MYISWYTHSPAPLHRPPQDRLDYWKSDIFTMQLKFITHPNHAKTLWNYFFLHLYQTISSRKPPPLCPFFQKKCLFFWKCINGEGYIDIVNSFILKHVSFDPRCIFILVAFWSSLHLDPCCIYILVVSWILILVASWSSLHLDLCFILIVAS